MRYLVILMAAVSVPLGLFNLLGSVVAAIWLIVLGMWFPVGISLALLFGGGFLFGFVFLPPFFAVVGLAAKASQKGFRLVSVVLLFVVAVCTAAIMVGSANAIMNAYSQMGPQSAQFPLILLSYGIATAPWTALAYKEEPAPDGRRRLATPLFFYQLGYLIAGSARVFGGAISSDTPLWILCISMAIGGIIQLMEELEALRAHGADEFSDQ